MTLGEKLSSLRKEHRYTQEELADILGVSRQAVSKWESNLSYPETEKLIKLGELYHCSMDYLLKEDEDRAAPNPKAITLTLDLNRIRFERKSKRSICGLPLWHVNIGYGCTARGVLAVGFFAKGILSVGLLSLGVVSFGLCSLGLLALGVLTLGLLSFGTISVGAVAFGAVSIGIVSVGALSIGLFSIGAMANGTYFAAGDHARAFIALGDTKAIGDAWQKVGGLSAGDRLAVTQLQDEIVPFYLSWAKEVVKLFL